MPLWHVFRNRRGEAIAREITQVLVSRRTAYQLLEIVDTVTYGRTLYLDHKIQSAALDEFIYHEALVQPAMLLAERPRRVFVAGGGEGATLREVLRHRTVERLVMVDIDAEAVAACREHLAAWHQGAFDDPRVELVHADARQVLADSGEQFDVVIIDITDPLTEGPSYRLFTVEFYQLVAARLAPGGVLAVQAESTDIGTWDAHLAVVHTVRQVFPYVAPYRAHVPSFVESWGFLVASRTRAADQLAPAEVDARLQAAGITDLRFYDGVTHQALFQLPRMLRAAQARWTRVITDAAPIVLDV
ncbi:MAG TPA: fused MFS/spermidine synthase [Chloroflexota bacterium]|jgi:spermidine synthase|nr:fused MFS/spermidine synthase [Chloroflexota bacterium]